MMSLKFFLLSIAILSILTVWTHSLRAENCPPNVDPVYCAAANETGGKVYSGTPEENFKALEKNISEEVRSHEREAFANNLNRFFTDILNGVFFFSPVLIGFFLLERPLQLFHWQHLTDKRHFHLDPLFDRPGPGIQMFFYLAPQRSAEDIL